MITLCKHIPAKHLPIWSPRWHDKRVLIPDYKVADNNIIQFTKDSTLSSDKLHYVSGKTVKKYKKESNGSVMCYCVPLTELQDFETAEHCLHEV